MLRALLYILTSIFAITFIRMVIGILTRGMGDLLNSELNKAPQGAPRSSPMPAQGELKPCARCGTYILASTQFRGTAKGDPIYFCSDACQRAFPV